MTAKEMFRELLKTWPGKAGVILLLTLVVISGYVVIRFPLDWGKTVWANPAEWADNPKSAPPVWASLLTSRDSVRQASLKTSEPSEVVQTGQGRIVHYTLRYEFKNTVPPSFFSFRATGLTFRDRPPVLRVSLARPDGTEVVLLREAVRGPREGEESPYQRFHDQPLRVGFTTERNVADVMSDLYRDEYGQRMLPSELLSNLNTALFGEPDPDNPGALRLLPGQYEFKVRATFRDRADSLEEVRFIVGGTVFGWMGTDSLGRNLTEGLLFGLPIALFIGLLASVVTTFVGTSLGIISGYVGGKTDLAIQRFADIVANVPLLPLLIFLVFIVGSNLFLIILFLIAFSWPGLTILIRSMVLQLREGHLVEAAVTMGASKWRIMYRHIFPQMAPFVIAQMIFFAPAAILAEAGLSFLGLGDPSIPTWGQILESGFRTGAVFLGYWWWVIPPGVLIIITALAFMLISLGMEPVLNPRLRRAR